jgi:hypothetical protein
MNIAIVTMVYNESVNLPIWIRHYRSAAPSATLFVVDHSSDDGSTDHIPEVNKLPLPRNEMDEWTRTHLINHLQRALLQYYDCVIYTDCDELIVPDPAKSLSIEAHLAAQSYEYTSPVGLNVIHLVDVEAPIDLAQPLLSQRRYCQFEVSMCKPVITRIPLSWQPGFHECDKPIRIDEDLYIFHTKAVDQHLALNRLHVTQNVRWSQKAIEANHGCHHRYDDARFVREFFLDRVNQFRKLGAQPFEFHAEIARMQRDSFESSGVFRVRPFTGPIAEIPDRFRQAF